MIPLIIGCAFASLYSPVILGETQFYFPCVSTRAISDLKRGPIVLN
jgi:hypothetical protein